MQLYRAPRHIIDTSESLVTAADLTIGDADPDEMHEAVVALLETQLTFELGQWLAGTWETLEERHADTQQLAATWIALQAARFELRARDLSREVEDTDGTLHVCWEESALQVAVTIGTSSGDWPTATSYLETVTTELVDGREPF